MYYYFVVACLLFISYYTQLTIILYTIPLYIITEGKSRCTINLTERKKQAGYNTKCTGCADNPNRSVIQPYLEPKVYKGSRSTLVISNTALTAAWNILMKKGYVYDPTTNSFDVLKTKHVVQFTQKEDFSYIYAMLEFPEDMCVDWEYVMKKLGVTTMFEDRKSMYVKELLQKGDISATSTRFDTPYDDDADLSDYEDESFSHDGKAISPDGWIGTNHLMVAIVLHDRIHLDTITEIAKLLRVDLVYDLLHVTTATNLLKVPSDVPDGQKRYLLLLFDRRVAEVGIYRAWDRLCLESGGQLFFGLPSQSEHFGWNEDGLIDKNKLGMKGAKEVIRIMKKAGVTDEDRKKSLLNKSHELVDSWAATTRGGVGPKDPTTGKCTPAPDPDTQEWSSKSKPQISTQVLTSLYMIGKGGERNDIEPCPCNAWESGMGTSKIFDTSCYDMNESDKKFCNKAQAFADIADDGEFHVFIVLTNSWLYGNVFEPQLIYLEAGFVRERSSVLENDLGGGNIVFSKKKSFVVMTGAPGLAGDTQDIIPSINKEYQSVMNDIVHNVVRFATGEIDEVTEENYNDYSTLGNMGMTHCSRGLHIPLLNCGVVYRQSLLEQVDPGARAIDHYAGSKTPPDEELYPSSRLARSQLKNKDKKTNRASELPSWRVQNMLSDTDDDDDDDDDAKNKFESVLNRVNSELERSSGNQNIKQAKRQYWQRVFPYLKVSIEAQANKLIKAWAESNGIKLETTSDGARADIKTGNERKIIRDYTKNHYNPKEEGKQYLWVIMEGKMQEARDAGVMDIDTLESEGRGRVKSNHLIMHIEIKKVHDLVNNKNGALYSEIPWTLKKVKLDTPSSGKAEYYKEGNARNADGKQYYVNLYEVMNKNECAKKPAAKKPAKKKPAKKPAAKKKASSKQSKK